MSHVPRIN